MNGSEGAIVQAMTVTGLSVTVGTVASGHRPLLKPILGTVAAGFVLLSIAQSPKFAPVAVQLAALIAVTAALTSGYFAFTGIARYFATPQTAKETP